MHMHIHTLVHTWGKISITDASSGIFEGGRKPVNPEETPSKLHPDSNPSWGSSRIKSFIFILSHQVYSRTKQCSPWCNQEPLQEPCTLGCDESPLYPNSSWHHNTPFLWFSRSNVKKIQSAISETVNSTSDKLPHLSFTSLSPFWHPPPLLSLGTPYILNSLSASSNIVSPVDVIKARTY